MLKLLTSTKWLLTNLFWIPQDWFVFHINHSSRKYLLGSQYVKQFTQQFIHTISLKLKQFWNIRHIISFVKLIISVSIVSYLVSDWIAFQGKLKDCKAPGMNTSVYWKSMEVFSREITAHNYCFIKTFKFSITENLFAPLYLPQEL